MSCLTILDVEMQAVGVDVQRQWVSVNLNNCCVYIIGINHNWNLCNLNHIMYCTEISIVHWLCYYMHFNVCRFRSPLSYMVSVEPFPDGSRSMLCKFAQMGPRPITFLRLWPATDHEPHCRLVPSDKIWRRTESTPWSGWWCSHMAGSHSDCITRGMKWMSAFCKYIFTNAADPHFIAIHHKQHHQAFHLNVVTKTYWRAMDHRTTW